MLEKLSIRNFALIEKLDLELEEGLNVLTGETGAGKSILIEALSFLLGARSQSAWLRLEAEKAEVSGVFSVSAKYFPEELKELTGSGEEGLFLRRDLDKNGKSRAYVNDRPVPVSTLGRFGEVLVDFHGQHDQQTLLKPALQLELLDRFSGLEGEKAELKNLYDAWKSLRGELETLRLNVQEKEKKTDMLRYQIKEIEQAGLHPEEEKELEENLPRFKHAGRLHNLSSQAYGTLYEQEGACLEGVRKAEKWVSEIAALDPSLQDLVTMLQEARIRLEEAASGLGNYRQNLNADPEALDRLIGRRDLLEKLKRKYGATLEEVLSCLDRLRREYSALEHSDEKMGELSRSLSKQEQQLRKQSGRIHEKRTASAKELSRKVEKELSLLGMPKARFVVEIRPQEEFGPDGMDRVEFFIAPNPGEGSKPFREIASGGELSRMMLALKTVFAGEDRIPTLVFDEVDAGVGGTVSRCVGEKLSVLSRTHQVLCVTHLPQIASFARAHFSVSKEIADTRTRTHLKKLSSDERLEELARLLGGREVTPVSLRHAKELLSEAAKS